MENAFFREENGFREVTGRGICYYSADLIPFPHGFSSRLGGVSTEKHLASLNLGYKRGEDDKAVDENYRRFFSAVFDTDDLSARAEAPQTHSAVLHYAPSGGVYPEGDGLYTDRSGVILTVKIADCLPILLADRKRRLVAALHAGWRGTVAGIAEKGVAALVSMGSRSEDIVAALGIAIGSCCYEVGEDFFADVAEAQSYAFASRHIQRRQVENGQSRLFADIRGMNRELLLAAGVLPAHIAASPLCTACQSARFFSHRASKGLRGTMAASIMLP